MALEPVGHAVHPSGGLLHQAGGHRGAFGALGHLAELVGQAVQALGRTVLLVAGLTGHVAGHLVQQALDLALGLLRDVLCLLHGGLRNLAGTVLDILSDRGGLLLGSVRSAARGVLVERSFTHVFFSLSG
ncbi:hypothetical protein FY030_06285 [Ornithinimicrobium pratense]|uniref:Uncharacterized protein n=1 Tax=Ornithinimicrobium pratense TaxID=2593973 RepID=A0A5J6V500_9MICO|nr:hypothetical protein FY030_06285 [Ornithinimicrobium pratense]